MLKYAVALKGKETVGLEELPVWECLSLSLTHTHIFVYFNVSFDADIYNQSQFGLIGIINHGTMEKGLVLEDGKFLM